MPYSSISEVKPYEVYGDEWTAKGEPSRDERAPMSEALTKTTHNSQSVNYWDIVNSHPTSECLVDIVLDKIPLGT